MLGSSGVYKGEFFALLRNYFLTRVARGFPHTAPGRASEVSSNPPLSPIYGPIQRDKAVFGPILTSLSGKREVFPLILVKMGQFRDLSD